MLTFQDCEQIHQVHGSPFYLFDQQRFINNYERFETAFVDRYNNTRIGYSYKTNYLPWICRIVRDHGGIAEVVSRLEYDLALRINQNPQDILFNGPLKESRDLELALDLGSSVNLDAEHELDVVARYSQCHPDRQFRVGLRININLSDTQGTSYVQDGLVGGRFGFSIVRIGEIVTRLAKAGVVVNALHGHSSSSTRSPWIFEKITRTLCRAAAEHAPSTIDTINVGGGFFGNVPPEFEIATVPSFDDYATTIVGTLLADAWAGKRRPRLILEPGTALVADTLSFVTRVVDLKTYGQRRLVVVDGNVMQTKPSGHSKRQPFRPIRANPKLSEHSEIVDVVGSTCMERDVLLEKVPLSVRVGDYLEIGHLGAYTIVMSPTFIHPAPAVLVCDGKDFIAARTKQTFEQAFANYSFTQQGGDRR
ncbi:MAG: hypothetical protein QM811_04120 [Pirellulales bacterium]